MHCNAVARLRTPDNVGSKIDISTPMMPMTTSSSTMVNPRGDWCFCE